MLSEIIIVFQNYLTNILIYGYNYCMLERIYYIDLFEKQIIITRTLATALQVKSCSAFLLSNGA